MSWQLGGLPHLECPQRPVTTGSWRTYRPVFEPAKCNLCLLCWVFCPDGTLKQNEEGIRVDLDYCKGCGICARECPNGAISMVEEDNGGTA